MGEIRRIERVSYNAGRVERVTRYTPEERAAKIREIEQELSEKINNVSRETNKKESYK